jgi:hypothetical protein
MSKGDNIYTFEVGSKENSFFCMRLASFLDRDRTVGNLDPDRYSDLWGERFNEAKAGFCFYRKECPVYNKTVKSGNIQLKLF